MKTFVALLAGLAAAAPSAFAQGGGHDAAGHGVTGHGPELLTTQLDPRYHDCTCRDQNGRSLRVGDLTCIASAQGSRLAICDMSQNITSWMLTDRDCHPELTQ